MLQFKRLNVNESISRCICLSVENEHRRHMPLFWENGNSTRFNKASKYLSNFKVILLLLR